MLDLAIRGGTLVTPAGAFEREVGIDGGRISEVAERVGAARRELDASGLHLLPATIDAHVHFNEPGRGHWEGIASGSAALAAGGGSVFVDMPLNSHPPTLGAAEVAAKRAAAEAASITDFALWGGLTPDNVERLPELAEAGVVGFKAFLCDSGIDEFRAVDDATLWRGMRIAAELDLPLALHAENDAIVRALAAEHRAAGRRDARDFVASRPPLAEWEAVSRALLLAEASRCRLHLVHLSSARSVDLVVQARARGVDASCETCPHYLHFTDADLDRIGPALKCAPPLRDERERRALWGALRHGDIDWIASDHSPAPPELKGGDDWFAAWGGVAGVQWTLPVLLSHAAAGDLPLPQLAALTAAAPAKRLRLAGKGALEPGFDADIALVALDEAWRPTRDDLATRHPLSAYENEPLRGRVHRTLRRGETIFRLDRPCAPSPGRMLRPAPVERTLP